MDLTLAGEAVRVTEPAILEQVARSYRGTGWPAGAAGDGFTVPYSAPGAGPPPWHRYQFTFHTVIGLSITEPDGATRWRFSRRRHPSPATTGRGRSHGETLIRLRPGDPPEPRLPRRSGRGSPSAATGICHCRSTLTHRTVAYRPGKVSEVLTEHYRRAHPEALGLPSR